MTNCRYCDAVTSNFVHDVCDRCSGYANFAKQRRAAQETGLTDNAKMSTLSEYIAKIERDTLDRAGVPNVVLMGTQSARGMYFDGQPLWRNEFMGQWTVSGTALEAEERRQRRDDHADALKYALSGCRRHGKSEAMRLADERSKHFNRVADAEVRWLVEQGMPIGDIELSSHGPLLGDACGESWLVHKPSQKPLVGFVMNAPDFSPLRYRDRVTEIVSPNPPTLREWLGPRVAELGPWAEVLRDLPEPAGHIEELLLNSSTGWLDYIASGEHGDEHGSLTRDAAIAATNPDDPFYEALQMALFTRHPAVKPDPRPAAIVCEDQYEVMP